MDVGHVYVEADVSARRSERVHMLVDTGATFTMIPPSLARRLGAPVLPRRLRIVLADGSTRRVQACSLFVRIGKRSGPTVALLLPGGDALLGVETLETLGLRVDPRTGRIEPSRPHGALLVGVRTRPGDRAR
jgi:predicted aspartyl protease